MGDSWRRRLPVQNRTAQNPAAHRLGGPPFGFGTWLTLVGSNLFSERPCETTSGVLAPRRRAGAPLRHPRAKALESGEGAEEIREFNKLRRREKFSPSSGDRVSQCACLPARDPPNPRLGAAVVYSKARFLRDATSRRVLFAWLAGGIGLALRQDLPAPRRRQPRLRHRQGSNPGKTKRPAHAQQPNVYLEPK